MSMESKSSLGTIRIDKDVLATIAGMGATDCIGVVGMAAKNIKDGIGALLGRDNFSKGVDVSLKNDQLNITLYIIVGYGTNIATVAANVVDKVKFNVEQYTGLSVDSINVIVQGVRVID